MTIQIINTVVPTPAPSEASSNTQSDHGEQFSDLIQQASSDKSDKSMSGNDASSASNVEADASVKKEKNNNQSTDDTKEAREKEAEKNTELLSSLAMQLIISNLPKPTPEMKGEKLAQQNNTTVNNSTASKPVQNPQAMQQMQKMLAADAKAVKNNQPIIKDSAQALAEHAALEAKQTTPVAIGGSSAQAWQIAQAAALAKMDDLAQPALAKTDTQKAILSEIKQMKSDNQPLELKAAHMALEKAVPLYPNNNGADIGAPAAQDFKTMLTQQNAIPMNDQQTKTAQAVSQVGNLIQAQVSAAITDSSATNNQILDTKPVVADVGQMKYDYATTVELSKDSIDATIKESYAANIKISPPDLGSVLAKLKIDKSGTQLVLVTENDRVKGIVEANLPQLREHFQQNNISLTQVQVQTALSGGAGDQFTGKQQATGEFTSSQQKDGTPVAAQPASDPQKNPNKIIDTYA